MYLLLQHRALPLVHHFPVTLSVLCRDRLLWREHFLELDTFLGLAHIFFSLFLRLRRNVLAHGRGGLGRSLGTLFFLALKLLERLSELLLS